MRSNDKLATSRLIQITDCHLGAQPGEKLLGLDTDESLQDVLALLSAEVATDLIVASGDIAMGKGAETAAYRRFPAMVNAVNSAPLAWLPGNHDIESLMRKASASVLMDRVELEHWQVLMLDSSVPGYEHGDLSAAELQRLEQHLRDCDKHTLVFVHHQPVTVGSAWIDQYVIRNGDRLLALLAGCARVKCLVWGHVHQEYAGSYGHFKMLATPSTCIQFKPYSHDFALDDLMPGYRWFELHADGSFETAVVRIADKHYDIDFSSEGY